MHCSIAIFACSAAAFVATCRAAALPHFLDPRAPHFSEIMVPEPDYVLRGNGSSNDTVAFQYRNGERAYETTMTVSLVNGNETYTLASNITFYNSWYVNATLNIVYAGIPDGNYTLIAEEYLEGDIYSEVQQPFGISHDPNSGAPTGDMSSVDPEATSSSAYILQPGRQQATATDGSNSPSAGTNEVAPSATAIEASTAQTNPPAHQHDGDGSIEEALHLLVDGFEASFV